MKKLVVYMVLLVCLVAMVIPAQAILSNDGPDMAVFKPVPVICSIQQGYVNRPMLYYNPKCTLPVQVLDFGNIRIGQNSTITVYVKNQYTADLIKPDNPILKVRIFKPTKYRTIPVEFSIVDYKPGMYKFFVTFDKRPEGME